MLKSHIRWQIICNTDLLKILIGITFSLYPSIGKLFLRFGLELLWVLYMLASTLLKYDEGDHNIMIKEVSTLILDQVDSCTSKHIKPKDDFISTS